MPLNIKDPEADRLARQVARLTGDTLTQTVVVALKEKLAREERRRRDLDIMVEEVLAIGQTVAALPTLDQREDEAILGYDRMTP
jgi:antitoxin VapB